MDRKHLTRLLDEIAHEEIPEDMNLLPNLTFVPASRRSYRARTLVKVAVLVALMLCAAAVGYALYQTVTGDPGITAMEESRRLTMIDETQPIAGDVAQQYALQVTLNYAYADANRIVVSYTVTAESDSATPIIVSHNPTLTVSGDPVQRMLLGSYGTPETSASADGQIGYTTTMVSNFDATTITSAPDAITLKLDVETAISYPESDEPYKMLLAGKAHFEFSVPFDPGRVLDAPQSATAEGMTMTLHKVVVAPSLTRIEMCYDDPAPEGRAWAVYGQLDVDGALVVENMQLNETGPNGESLDEAQPCHTLIIPAALDDQNGEWTLTITTMRLPGSEDPQQVIEQMHSQYGIDIRQSEWGGYEAVDNQGDEESDNQGDAALATVLRALQQGIDGPWVFTFTLPQ